MSKDLGHDLGFIAEQLGKIKSVAEHTGHTLVIQFRDIDRLVEKLKEYGISISVVKFDDPVVQAAWIAHTRGDSHTRGDFGPPEMSHEDELIREFVENS